jgi:hypothetical protein
MNVLVNDDTSLKDRKKNAATLRLSHTGLRNILKTLITTYIFHLLPSAREFLKHTYGKFTGIDIGRFFHEVWKNQNSKLYAGALDYV